MLFSIITAAYYIQPEQHGKTTSLPKIQKLAWRGGTLVVLVIREAEVAEQDLVSNS